MSVHSKIKNERLRRQMTYQQFGDAVGVTRGAVQQWEKGVTGPTRKNQPAVAKFLGISVAELMSADDDPRGAPPPSIEQAPDLPATSTILLSLSDDAVTLGAQFDKCPVEIREELHSVLMDYIAVAKRGFVQHGTHPEFHQAGTPDAAPRTVTVVGSARVQPAGVRASPQKPRTRISTHSR